MAKEKTTSRKKKTGPRGRWHEWVTKDGLLRIEGWARDGLTNEQIAHNMAIAPGTLYEWRNRYPEIAEVLKRTKEVVDREVENALYMRATGYSHPEDKIFLGPGGVPVVVKTIKHYPPDATSMIFWLKNRKIKEWRDRRSIEHSGGINIEKALKNLESSVKGENSEVGEGEGVESRELIGELLGVEDKFLELDNNGKWE